MLRRLPSLNALKAFEAAARHESFTRAAEELFVTQGAVSHQVKALEAELGFKLFNRERQRLVITDAGREYLNVVRDAFDRIALGTARLTQRQSSGVLTVSTSPDFAAKWLVHRLGRFGELHPGIDLRVSATMHHVDFAREDVDMAVRHGVGEASWQGLAGERLATEILFAVCSPALLRKTRKKLAPADVLDMPLLHLDDHGGWKRWLDAARVKAPKSLHGVVLNRESMVIDAAINGQGVGRARSTLAAWDLINKRARRAVPRFTPIGFGLLDRGTAGDCRTAKDRDVSIMAAGRSGSGSKSGRKTGSRTTSPPMTSFACFPHSIQFRRGNSALTDRYPALQAAPHRAQIRQPPAIKQSKGGTLC
jgi:LysR family glycine cleavage system transcriptional activator